MGPFVSALKKIIFELKELEILKKKYKVIFVCLLSSHTST